MLRSIAYVGQIIILAIGVLGIHRYARREAFSASPFFTRSSALIACLLALGCGLFEVVIFRVSSPPELFPDFVNAYYPAGLAVLHHDPAALRSLIGKGVSGFVNIPLVAYLFAPVGWLPPTIAALVFTAIGISLTIFSWFLICRMTSLPQKECGLLALLFLVNGPLVNAIKLGNMSYLILCFLAGGLALLRSGRTGWAGILLGFAAVIKPPLILFGIFFLFRRDIRGVLGFTFVGIATVAVSLLLFGLADNLHWFEICIIQYSHSWLAAFSVQSIPAFLVRLRAPPAVLLDWISHPPEARQEFLAQILVGILFLIAALACIRSQSQRSLESKTTAAARRDLQYVLVICLSLVSSPLSWSHYYAWLLIPTAFFLGSSPSFPASRGARGLAWAAIALMTPVVLWPRPIANVYLMIAYKSVAVSHLLFSSLIWFGLIAWWLARSGGLLAERKCA